MIQIIWNGSGGRTAAYAAAELRKYIYQLCGESAEILEEETKGADRTFLLSLKEALMPELGSEGYCLRSGEKENRQIQISAATAQGLLYGVYGLLDDHYGLGFYFSGDVLPQKKAPLPYMPLQETKIPRQRIRGVLPWTNFPQSATVYSMQDWKFILEQMARMRLNFLNLHNYNGQKGWGDYSRAHNEIFHNFMLDGKMSKVWNPTARVPHSWNDESFAPEDYRFGADELFGDYDFGADATLHNEFMDNISVFRKGSSQLQFILHTAHQLGIQVGLGIDLNLIPDDYPLAAGCREVAEARAHQIAVDYPELDYLLLYYSEGCANPEEWKQAFQYFYPVIKQCAPQIQIAVSGWGLPPEEIEKLPPEIIAAPIAPHSKNAQVLDGSVYGEREYWACPWVERDYGDSMYFATYNMKLSETIETYQAYSSSATGLTTLTWRLTDAVEPKISYIAKAPWDTEKKYSSAEALYREYAEKCYGKTGAEAVLSIINENEAFATGFSECQPTPGFFGGSRESDIRKAREQIAVVDAAIAAAEDIGAKSRLSKLRARLSAVYWFDKLDQNFPGDTWEHSTEAFEGLVRGFIDRVDDISSLGNVTSVESRFVKLHYLKRERELCGGLLNPPPHNLVVKNTPSGAKLCWQDSGCQAEYWRIYRSGRIVCETAATGLVYEDVYDGKADYQVSAVREGKESILTPSVPCLAGKADCEPVRVLSISPPTRALSGQPVDFSAILLDNSSPETLQAFLYYRIPGKETWNRLEMERQTDNIFGVRLTGRLITPDGLEYYVEGTDGKNTGVFPATAPELAAGLTVEENAGQEIPTPCIRSGLGIPAWESVNGNVQWYRIYCGAEKDFKIGPQNYLTYVSRDTVSFRDANEKFSKWQTEQPWFYKVTAVDIDQRESLPSEAMTQSWEPHLYPFAAAQPSGSYAATADGQAVNLIRHGACFQFPDVALDEVNAITVIYSACNSEKGNRVEIWVDGSSQETSGSLIGAAFLPSTGDWSQREQITIPILRQNGQHTLFFRCIGGQEYLFQLTGFIPGTADIVIRTTGDTFAIGPGCPSIQLSANDAVQWSFQTMEGRPAEWAQISSDGILTATKCGMIRVTATSVDGRLYGKRLVQCGVI